ncbi:C-type lectin domain family 2 member B-like [Strix uralensis]|uniref:C-type lectin domain family 2 member B-like n=1 Tax=Strix uralensis TaxID=36305 RepID=UPI003DA73D96
MESEDEQKPEGKKALVWKVNSTNAQQGTEQEAAARSWVQKTGRRCKEWFLQKKFIWLSLLVGLALCIIVCAVRHGRSHHGKFPPEQCPSEWIGYKKKCYFISEEEKNWTSSQTFCAKNQSLLAVFENQKEMQSLAKLLKIDDFWIGLRKKGETFYWENDIALKVDSFHIQNHSECAYLDTFTISTSSCSLPRRWICIQTL